MTIQSAADVDADDNILSLGLNGTGISQQTLSVNITDSDEQALTVSSRNVHVTT